MTLRPFRFLFFLFTSVLFLGCCANDRCNCNDGQIDAVTLRFDIGAGQTSGSYFTAAEADTVYVLRYNAPLKTLPAAHDSIALPTTRRFGENPIIVINNNAPFRAASGRKLDKYAYRVLVRLANKRLNSFMLDSIKIQDYLDGNGCCTCYHNRSKKVFLDGAKNPVDITENEGNPMPITLQKH